MAQTVQQHLSLLETPAAASAVLDPLRLRILKHLVEPGSASNVARTLELPRQRVAYHVKELEKAGLLSHLEDVRRGNCVQRVMQATARHYLVAPRALGELAVAGKIDQDRFSSSYLVALAAQTIDDIASLRKAAATRELELPTLSLSGEVAFSSQREQHEFARELTEVVGNLVATYRVANTTRKRRFRLTVGAYPIPSHEGSEPGQNEDEREQ